ncbi:MAG: aspartate aminotransferase family protein [Bacteroidota bacterium]|nr:aspartate aminotransferase family protein [Bacteroidota bacterium]
MTERELFYRFLGLPGTSPLGIEISKAEGLYLYDPSGKRYIDLVSGICVSNIGHRHPVVLEAIREQIDKYLYLNVYGEIIQSPQVRLAEKLVKLLPHELDQVYFVNSGSEAIEGAVKLAKRATRRTCVVSFKNAYHGSTQGALSILGNECLKSAFRPLIPGGKIIPFNDSDALEQIDERTACVVAETIQAEAGIILPDPGYIKALRDRCTKTGTLLVIDDVQMGFGRTGKMFSFENYGICPDILVLAKALGFGMPLGAFIAPKKIMSMLTHDPELGHITTFGGHPVSCAASLAGLDVMINSGVINHVSEKGLQIEKKIEKHPFVKEIRRTGLMLGIDISNPELRNKFSERCNQNGLIIDWFLFRPSTFRIAPPLVISDDEIEEACGLILKSMDETLA